MSDLLRYRVTSQDGAPARFDESETGYWTPWHIAQRRCNDLRAKLEKCQQLADRALGSPVTEAAILRLQAEAVDEVNRKLTEISEGMDGRGMDPVLVMQYAASTAGEEAKRFRQQADEAERAGGEQ